MVVVNNEVPIGVGLSEFDACWWLNNNQNHSFLAYPPTFQSWHLTTLSVCGLEDNSRALVCSGTLHLIVVSFCKKEYLFRVPRVLYFRHVICLVPSIDI